MSRPGRIEYEGAFYHVMNRGNCRQSIFLRDYDRLKFFDILGSVEERYNIAIYCYVLMSNHYHLLIETPSGNLSRAIQRLNSEYASYFARCHKKPGHLFQGRFKAMLVEKDEYLIKLSRYIHLNPVRAEIVKNPEEYRWSSLFGSTKKPGKLPFKLHNDQVLSYFGKKRAVASKKYLEFVRDGMEESENPGLDAYSGWILGGESWMKKVVEKCIDSSSPEISGVKQLKSLPSVGKLEVLVCHEFSILPENLKIKGYKNIARMAMIYLSIKFAGLTLTAAADRYKVPSSTAVSKAVSRFRERLLREKTLQAKFDRILSNVKM